MYTHDHLHVTTHKSSTVTILLTTIRKFGWSTCNSWPLIGLLTVLYPVREIREADILALLLQLFTLRCTPLFAGFHVSVEVTGLLRHLSLSSLLSSDLWQDFLGCVSYRLVELLVCVRGAALRVVVGLLKFDHNKKYKYKQNDKPTIPAYHKD